MIKKSFSTPLDKRHYQTPKCLFHAIGVSYILNSSDIDVSLDDYELGDEDEDDWD